MTLRGGMGRNGRRLRVNPTDGWEQIELLCRWPEQWDYELIQPPGALRRLRGREDPGGGKLGQHALPETRPLLAQDTLHGKAHGRRHGRGLGLESTAAKPRWSVQGILPFTVFAGKKKSRRADSNR
jgi:hypothetical protein